MTGPEWPGDSDDVEGWGPRPEENPNWQHTVAGSARPCGRDR